MTPQERQLVAELFDRLAALEQNPRDADAERLIRDGLRQAPNAIYSLVQTVLVQDEALKAANAHIEELQSAAQAQQQNRGFLDSARGSVPNVPQGRPAGAPMGPPPGFLNRAERAEAPRNDPWNQGAPMGAPAGYRPGYEQPAAPMQEPARPGGSFLGTAAAAAAGMLGGALLMNGIRSMLGGHQQTGPAAGAFDQLSGPRAGENRTPWDNNNSTGDLSREAGLNDIGNRRTAFGDFDRNNEQAKPAGFFDNNNSQNDSYNDDNSDSYEEDVADDGSYDSDTA
jgi:hypothetical protein